LPAQHTSFHPLIAFFHFGLQEGDGKILSPAQSAASGFVAACIGPTLNNPFDVVKTRM